MYYFWFIFSFNLCFEISLFFNQESCIAIIKMTWKASLIFILFISVFYRSGVMY